MSMGVAAAGDADGRTGARVAQGELNAVIGKNKLLSAGGNVRDAEYGGISAICVAFADAWGGNEGYGW